MKPYGLALLDYHKGNKFACCTIIRDDGLTSELPIDTFFRPAQSLELEKYALDRCYGHILDAGAGAGIHSLFLQEKGLKVCAIDVIPEAVQIMVESGVAEVHQADIMSFSAGEFDTVLMMGHGMGMVENIAGLEHFLRHIHTLLKPRGQILLTSMDVRITKDAKNLSYHQKNIESGRYFGEIRMRFIYQDTTGPICGWLHVDAETLKAYSSRASWRCEVLCQQGDGNYLARLF
jgi:SAM-dependent methyltransferase